MRQPPSSILTPRQSNATLDISMESDTPSFLGLVDMSPNPHGLTPQTESSLWACIEAQHERNSHSFQGGTLRNPIDKYTKGVMPKVQVSDPMAALNYIDLDLIMEWEKVNGEKLLAHPFNTEVQQSENHNLIKARILSAVVEITSGAEIEVSSPIPSTEAKCVGCTPSAFLIYNLSTTQVNLLLQ